MEHKLYRGNFIIKASNKNDKDIRKAMGEMYIKE